MWHVILHLDLNNYLQIITLIVLYRAVLGKYYLQQIVSQNPPRNVRYVTRLATSPRQFWGKTC